MPNFQEILSNLLKSENLSTVTGKQVLGISKTQLGRYLSGYYLPSLKNALIICNHFKCSLDFLLGIDDLKNRFGNFKEPSFELFCERYASSLNKQSLTQYALSKELNFNRNNIIYWNKKRTFPSLDILTKLSVKFHIPIEFLIGRTDYKE